MNVWSEKYAECTPQEIHTTQASADVLHQCIADMQNCKQKTLDTHPLAYHQTSRRYYEKLANNHFSAASGHVTAFRDCIDCSVATVCRYLRYCASWFNHHQL